MTGQQESCDGRLHAAFYKEGFPSAGESRWVEQVNHIFQGHLGRL